MESFSVFSTLKMLRTGAAATITLLVAVLSAACTSTPRERAILLGPKTHLNSIVLMPPGCPSVGSGYADMRDLDGRTRSEAHRGLDIAAALGTSVYAAAPGKVIYAEWQMQGGNSILIWHGPDRYGNRIITYYVHLDRIAVEVGTTVKRGELIGTLGATGSNMPRSRTPHLHFEVLIYPYDEPRFLFGWLRDLRLSTRLFSSSLTRQRAQP